MQLRTVLRNFIKVVSDEADQNPEFAERLWTVFESARRRPAKKIPSPKKKESATSRPANRRPAAVVNPIALAAQGEAALRAELVPLTLDQLKDIVAEYGMDNEKLVMKWKNPDRVIGRIVKISISRAHKGEAFRS